MIEDHALVLLIAMIAIPCLIGIIVDWFTRPRKTYYKSEGGVWYKKKW